MVGCFCQNGLDIFQTFSKSVCLFGCWLAVWSKVVDDVVAGMSRSETTMEPPPEDTVPSEQPDGFSLKIFFLTKKKECVTWFNKNLSVPSYSCLAIVVDLWILKNIWDTMSIYQSTPWWTFFLPWQGMNLRRAQHTNMMTCPSGWPAVPACRLGIFYTFSHNHGSEKSP